MTSKNLTDPSTEFIVLKLYNTWIEDLPLAISKVSEERILKELFLMSVQKNRSDIRKIITSRMDALGFGYDKSLIL